MSIFASETQATVPVLSDPPHTLTIRKLTGREVEKAQAEHTYGVVHGLPGRGWATKFHEALMKGLATDADAERTLADPLSGYDRLSVVQAGLVGWSYKEPDGTPKAVTPERVADMDDEALEQTALAIMRLSKPALFEPATLESRESAQKNG